MTLVGITGTNGKTTSAAIFRHLLGRRGPSASIGTLGAVGADGRVIPGTEGLTTPGPVETAQWLRRLADDGVRAWRWRCPPTRWTRVAPPPPASTRRRSPT
jgi:UDP-N-acetylmuramoyl-L-alanyl-D-glutamate--2,6-diaminopimelate ligase